LDLLRVRNEGRSIARQCGGMRARREDLEGTEPSECIKRAVEDEKPDFEREKGALLSLKTRRDPEWRASQGGTARSERLCSLIWCELASARDIHRNFCGAPLEGGHARSKLPADERNARRARLITKRSRIRVRANEREAYISQR